MYFLLFKISKPVNELIISILITSFGNLKSYFL